MGTIARRRSFRGRRRKLAGALAMLTAVGVSPLLLAPGTSSASSHREAPLIAGLPKLDNTEPYVQKLAAMLTQSSIRSLTVVHMEVPCCMGLVRITQAARQLSGLNVPLAEVVISTRGDILAGA